MQRKRADSTDTCSNPTVASPGLLVLPGPCFIRCSRGVNAKLVLPLGRARETLRDGVRLADGTPYFGLNTVGLCVKWLGESLGHTPPAPLLRAYEAYEEACSLLGDSVNGDVRGDIELNDIVLESNLLAALPLLDIAADFVIEEGPPPGGWPAAPSARRRSFCAEWQESFYGSTMRIEVAASGQPGEREESRGTRPQAQAFAGGSAEEADSALQAARKGLAAPSPGGREGGGPPVEGEMCGSYGTRSVGRGGVAVYTGKLRAVQADNVLRGTWEEEGASGDMEMQLSGDGLRFEGSACMGDQRFDWSGVRLAEPAIALGGSAQQRWQARVLSLRSLVRLRFSRFEEAAADAAAAVRACPWLPAAWDAVVDVAATTQDWRTAGMALRELLYLQPTRTPGLPRRVSNKRREQQLLLDKILRGELKGSPLLSRPNPIMLYLAVGVMDNVPSVDATAPAPSDARWQGGRGAAADTTLARVGTENGEPRLEGASLSDDWPADLKSKLDAIFDGGYAPPEESPG